MSKTFVPAPAETGDDQLFSVFGTFRFSDTENEYLVTALPADIYSARLAIAVSLLNLLFVINDYLLYGGTLAFYGLLAVRGLTLIASVGVLFVAARVSRLTFDSIFFAWALFISGMSIYVVAHRPPGFIGVILANIFTLLLMYLVMPISPVRQLLAGGLLSLGHIMYSLLIEPTSMQALVLFGPCFRTERWISSMNMARS